MAVLKSLSYYSDFWPVIGSIFNCLIPSVYGIIVPFICISNGPLCFVVFAGLL